MNQQQIFIEMALKAWNVQLSRADKFFDSLSDEQLQKKIAPGKNTVLYLLGHLVAVHDGMITLYGLGDRQYAHLDEAFVKNPDKSGLPRPSAGELRTAWKKTNELLATLFAKLSAGDWFGKHTSMTDEDLQKEPTRNKLSVLLNRTGHLAYHLGQVILAK
jgi:hypothetical protein